VKEAKFILQIRASLAILLKHPLLFVPDIIYILLTVAIVLAFLSINDMFQFFIIIKEGTYVEMIKSQYFSFTENLNGFVKLIASLVTLLVVNVLIGVTILSMRYTLIKNYVNDNKFKFKSFYKENKRYIMSLIVIKVFLLAVYAIPFAVFVPVFFKWFGVGFLSLLIPVILYIFLRVIFFFAFPLLYLGKRRNPFVVIKDSSNFFSKNKRYTFYCLIIVLVVTAILTLATSAMYSAARSWVGGGAEILFFAIIMFIIGALIDVTLKIWVETFSFVAYKTRF